MKRWLLINQDALNYGYFALPTMLLIQYFASQGRTVKSAMPVIFFYVFAKTIPFVWRAVGPIKQPWQLLRYDSAVVVFGTLIMMIPSLVAEGATILGCGMATMPAAYQTVRDHFKQAKQWPAKGTGIPAIGELLFLIILGFVLSKWHWEAFVLELFIVELGYLSVAWGLPNPWPDQKQIGSGRFNWRQLLVAIIVFLMAIATRGLKQTGLPILVWLLLAMWLVMLLGFSRLQRQAPTYRMWTFVVGAIYSGFMIYSVFNFDASGQSDLLIASFLLFVLGMVGGLIGIVKLKWLQDPRHLTILLIVSDVCMLIPNNIIYLIGFFLLVGIASAINTIVWRFYREDQRIPVLNHRFTRLYYNVLGSISAQVCLIATILLVNFFYDRQLQQILRIYYQHQTGVSLAMPMYWVRVICVVLLAIVMVVCWPHLESVLTNKKDSRGDK